jgi:hypothetical protein
MTKTIHFVDYGQDFLQFDINSKGVVTDVRPSQAWAWKGIVIINHVHLQRGDHVQFSRVDGIAGEVIKTIIYPVEAVTSSEEVAHGPR